MSSLQQTYVLQRNERLPYRAPGICAGLRFIDGLPIGDEGILDLSNTRVAPAGETSFQGCAGSE